MALKQSLAVKTVIGNSDLVLQADPGESFLVKDIRIFNPASNYITLQTEKTTVGFFRVGGTLGSHLPFTPGRTRPGIAAHSHLAGIFGGSETGADQALFVSLTDGAGTTIGANVLGKSGEAENKNINTDSVIANLNTNVPTPGMKTLLGWAISQGLMTGYPVGVGETFQITGAAQNGAIQMVIYEIYDEDDQKPEAPNGSHASEYTFVNYGNTGAAITSPGSYEYDTTLNPGEFPGFPFGKVVPAKTEVSIIGICGSDFAPQENTADDYQHTQFLKLIADRITLFDEDRNGLLFLAPAGANVGGRDRIGEGQSLIGNYSDVDVNLPFFLEEPLTFKAGDDLDIYLTTAGDGTYQDIDIADQEIALIMQVRRAE